MPTEIKNLKKAANRILKAIKSKEKIILYGDADLDGITSVIILQETIKNLQGEVTSVYFPDRENEGYGINKKALNILKDTAPALLISLDLGIGNVEEVKLAKKLGFEVIIIDHHELLGKPPEASIIVDPKQEADTCPFKILANVGIVFRLSQALLGKDCSKNLRNSFLELTALGTIADLMPETGENKAFIEDGLKSLMETFRPGLKVFLRDHSNESASVRYIAQKIIAVLNAAETTDHINEAYSLLTLSSIEKAEDLVQILIGKSRKRQQKIREITDDIEKRVLSKLDDIIVFEGDLFWPLVFTGSVASRICRQYEKPTFIFKKGEKESCGSVRNPKNINSVEAMKSCSDLLMTFGGHPLASGFRIKNENLEKFKERLIEYFEKLS